MIAVGAVFALGLGARRYCLDCYSLWMDEVDSIALVQRGLGAIFGDRFGEHAEHTPWHYLLVWLTVQPLDPTMSSMPARLPAPRAGALLVPLVFALGRAVWAPGRAAGRSADGRVHHVDRHGARFATVFLPGLLYRAAALLL